MSFHHKNRLEDVVSERHGSATGLCFVADAAFTQAHGVPSKGLSKSLKLLICSGSLGLNGAANVAAGDQPGESPRS